MPEGTGRPPPPRADHRLERSRTRSEEASDIRLGLRRPRQVTSGGASSQRRPPRLRRGRRSYWNRRTASCRQRHVPLEPAQAGIRSGKHRCGPVTLITLPSPERRTESVPLLRGLRALDVPDSHDHRWPSRRMLAGPLYSYGPAVPSSGTMSLNSQRRRRIYFLGIPKQ